MKSKLQELHAVPVFKRSSNSRNSLFLGIKEKYVDRTYLRLFKFSDQFFNFLREDAHLEFTSGQFQCEFSACFELFHLCIAETLHLSAFILKNSCVVDPEQLECTLQKGFLAILQ